jgi:branched-chain amino acid transport system permease protein
VRLVELGLVSGIGLGAVYMLIATSYTLILASSGVFNFGQAGIVSLGAIGTYYLWKKAGIPLVPSLLLCMLFGVVLGTVSERVAVSWFYSRRETLTKSTLVSTLGLGLLLTALAGVIFGSAPIPVPAFVSTPSWNWLGISVQPQYVIMLIVGLGLCVLLDQLLVHTEVGLVIRATIQDREGAALLGIRPRTVTIAAFAVGGAMAALAGALLAPVATAYPTMGNDFAVYGFAAMAIGGYGSFRGAAFGGLLIGIVAGLEPIYLNPQLAGPVVYVILLVVLLVRPVGIFGIPGAFGASSIREA